METDLHTAVIAYRESWMRTLNKAKATPSGDADLDLETENHCRIRIQTADLFAELVADDQQPERAQASSKGDADA